MGVFFAYTSGPDPPARWRAGLAINVVVLKMSLRNNKTIIYCTTKFTPGGV